MTDLDEVPDEINDDFEESDDAETGEFEPLPDEDEETLDLTPPSLLDDLPEDEEDEEEG